MSDFSQNRWVLLPGTLCTPEVFAPLLDRLGVPESNRDFLIADAPHVGDYDARLRDKVTGGEILCGFSLGALVLAHNLDALQRARAVVLLALNPLPDPPENRANREAARDRVLAGGAGDWVTQNWAAMSSSESADLREFVSSMALDTAHLIPAQTELAASRPGAADQLATTELPLIFVTGANDGLTPAHGIKALAQNARSAHLSVLDGLGHFALLEAPDQVAAAIRQGLSAVSPEATAEILD